MPLHKIIKHAFSVSCLTGLAILKATLANATNYYVSATGNDGNSSASTGSPLQTITMINTSDLNPGDTVRFRGSNLFSGKPHARQKAFPHRPPGVALFRVRSFSPPSPSPSPQIRALSLENAAPKSSTPHKA
ncbi:MAG: hypothetical protein K0R17_3668 [Rariglobus sp.]|jgi:hypothetical protein|nr:hypothetical protein [Rariglobus sp.]